VLQRAENRIETAILSGSKDKQVNERLEIDDVEIPSFPIAVMMVAATKDAQLKRRFALAEAKRASNLLKQEDEEKVTAIAAIFNWKIRHAIAASRYNHTLHFTDYLRNAAYIQDTKWKLANRVMQKGEVYLTKVEASRLLEEEVRRHIEKRLSTDIGELSKNITERVDKMKRLFNETKGKAYFEEMPAETVIEAFPPCIRELYNTAPSGRHMSHIGRFALTSFLLNSGMPPEAIIEHFRPTSDFSEKLTRYQVEHIAGGRGSRNKYIPPRCDTLRTHGICPGIDDTCRGVRHPLTYYKRKLRAMKPQAANKSR
jgi:DNA primase large subunit